MENFDQCLPVAPEIAWQTFFRVEARPLIDRIVGLPDQDQVENCVCLSQSRWTFACCDGSFAS
jgi:hypothetical protein